MIPEDKRMNLNELLKLLLSQERALAKMDSILLVLTALAFAAVMFCLLTRKEK